MSTSEEETPFYIRTVEGDCYYVKNLDDAIKEFVSKEGYRLSLKAANGTEIIIRRETEPSEKDVLGNDIFHAEITVRRSE